MTVDEILAGESKNLEFKVERPKDSIKYMKSVVAFANGKGGRIIFGIDDKTRKVVGIPKDLVFSEIDAITTAISDSCEPTIIPDVYLQQVEEKAIIVVDIQPGRQRPYYIKSMGFRNGTFIRVSGTSRPADHELASEMYYEDEGRSYDNVVRTDLTVSEDEIRSLCSKMKEAAIRNAKSADQKAAVKDITKNQLLSWGLLGEGEDGKIHPTNGYIFLLGQDSFHSMIQCALFKGITRGIFVDKREYTGPLWEEVEEAHRFVLRNIHLGARIVGVYRQDVYELPPDSIRELIINAVMNCSFLQSSHIQVALYDNRLEITSPGGLLPGVTLAKMREGFSKVRNKALAHAFLYMNMIEEWGSGIPKLIQEMREYGLKEPEFIDMDIGFRVNLYRNQEEVVEVPSRQGASEIGNTGTEDLNTSAKALNTSVKALNTSTKDLNTSTKKATKKYNETEEKLIALIRENPTITMLEMASNSGLSRAGVQYTLNKLRDKGIVEREGSKKKGKWIIRG